MLPSSAIEFDVQTRKLDCAIVQLLALLRRCACCLVIYRHDRFNGNHMVTNSITGSNFREFEHSGWQSVASPYHDYFARLTRQAIKPLLDAAGAGSSTDLLDVATGPGYVAAAAAQRGATVTGVDFSSVMVAKAQKDYPSITFMEGDAESLPFAEASFDIVCMSFGMLHLSKPEQAAAEAFRVLRPNGRFAFTVWSTPDSSPAFGIALSAIEKHGNSKVPLPPGPPFFRFSDMQESRLVLQQAGFCDVTCRQIPMLWQLDCAEDLFKAFFEGTPRTGGLLRAQSAEDLKAIETAMRDEASKYEKNGRIEIPMASVLAIGVKS